MKKSGSILIEVVASLLILSLTSAFIVGVSIQNNKIIKERILNEDVSLVLSNIINELKFNVSKSEIDELFKNDVRELKYDENLCENLVIGQFEDLELGQDIEIMKISQNERNINFKIRANVLRDENKVEIEKEFTKSWWMDEI